MSKSYDAFAEGDNGNEQFNALSSKPNEATAFFPNMVEI
jgi:hypothetical protein